MKKLRGAGDLIAVITKWTGIQWGIKALGINCNCPVRQEKLNVELPFKMNHGSTGENS